MKIMKKYMALLILFAAVVATLISCSYETVYDFLSTLSEFETVVEVTFESDDDIEIFESRLERLSYSVKEKNKHNDYYEYKLFSNYSLSEEEFMYVTMSYVATIVDDESNVILDMESVTDIKFDGVCLYVYTDDSFYNQYDKDTIYCTSIKIDNEVYSMFPYIRESEDEKYIVYIQPSEVPRSPLIKCAIAFSGELLFGDVEIRSFNVYSS